MDEEIKIMGAHDMFAFICWLKFERLVLLDLISDYGVYPLGILGEGFSLRWPVTHNQRGFYFRGKHNFYYWFIRLWMFELSTTLKVFQVTLKLSSPLCRWEQQVRVFFWVWDNWILCWCVIRVCFYRKQTNLWLAYRSPLMVRTRSKPTSLGALLGGCPILRLSGNFPCIPLWM